MNSVILCEGLDDVLILGYFIHKISKGEKWVYNNKIKVSENFDFSTLNKKKEIQSVYTRGKDKLLIWGVGGKNSFNQPMKALCKFNTNFPNERFEKIVIFSDKDKSKIDECIGEIEELFKKNGWDVSLENNKQNEFKYDVDGEIYKIVMAPLIIPFEVDGALETVLMAGISATDDEDKLVVDLAKKYIKNVIENDKITKYLTHDRLKLKAEFSAVISIINPDRSTALYDKLLMSQNWEEKEVVKKHFELIEKMFE